MALESATYLNQLVATNPTGTDQKAQGDDHIRILKAVLQTTFPNLTGAVTPTQVELNYVASVTGAIQAQLNARPVPVENTWVPTLSFGGASVGITYSTNIGSYQQVGSWLHYNFSMALTSKGSSIGEALITLPVAPRNNQDSQSAASVRGANGFLYTGMLTALPIPGTATLKFVSQTEAGFNTTLNEGNFADNTVCIVSGAYRTV
jgi:hypothetical protein